MLEIPSCGFMYLGLNVPKVDINDKIIWCRFWIHPLLRGEKIVFIRSATSNQQIEAEIPTSGQDGGIGRHTLPPHTTKRRIIKN